MKLYPTWAAFLGAGLYWATAASAQAPQPISKPHRDYGGWQAAPRATRADTPVRQANFQAQATDYNNGSLPVLPPAYGDGFSQPYAPATLPAAPNLPSTVMAPDETMHAAGGVSTGYDQFARPGGYSPATDVQQASGSGLRSTTQANGGVYPPNYAPQSGGPVYPPQTPAQAPQSNLRSIGSPSVAQQRQLHNGAEYTIPVVTQNPRFISPPPAPRVGNYATSPYQGGPFRLASYQQVTTQAGQPGAVAGANQLPQYQPVVGVHPTSYQQCGPNIPVGGAPQAVPGIVAPPTLPPNLTPQLYTPDNAGYKPLISLGQENYNVLLGRGVVGQPTVYVPGQPFRNFFRYLSP